jgi:hypothetical protein
MDFAVGQKFTSCFSYSVFSFLKTFLVHSVYWIKSDCPSSSCGMGERGNYLQQTVQCPIQNLWLYFYWAVSLSLSPVSCLLVEKLKIHGWIWSFIWISNNKLVIYSFRSSDSVYIPNTFLKPRVCRKILTIVKDNHASPPNKSCTLQKLALFPWWIGIFVNYMWHRLCGLVVNVPGYTEVRVRFPVLPDFLRSSGSGKGSTQPREYNWGDTWKKK